jgi:hypothetical protein
MIRIAKYAEEFVLLAKEEKALRDMTHRLIEIGKCNVPITFGVWVNSFCSLKRLLIARPKYRKLIQRFPA